jgi:L-ascorbate metabolism protein UlaG (beta-lactamase superfamily)
MKFLMGMAAVTLLALCAQGQTQTFKTSAGPVKITPIYHASTLIEAGGKIIYLDPTQKLQLNGVGNGPDLSGHPRADLILISDIHHDHMDTDAIAILNKADTVIIAPPSVVETVKNAKPIANGETRNGRNGRLKRYPCTT